MPTKMTPERFQDRWEAYRGEHQQVSGVWQLYQAIRKDAPDVLLEEAPWARKFSEAPANPNPLHCPYQSQRDNYRDANRTCFSSSCAMLVMQLRPGNIHSDDEYIREVFTYGDTTDATVQLSALKHFNINARFVRTGDKALLIKQIDKGIPVPCGYLHHGTPSHPTGGGHWLIAIGYDDTGVFVHDPWGEASLLDGTFPNRNGAKCHYSDARWTNPRWQPDGPKSGWCIIAEK